MNYEIKGKLIAKFAEQKLSDKFKKREFVIETNDKFTEQIKLQLVNDRTDLIEPYDVDDDVVVQFTIKGAKWKESYFVNLQAWKIQRVAGEVIAKVEKEIEVNGVLINDPPF